MTYRSRCPPPLPPPYSSRHTHALALCLLALCLNSKTKAELLHEQDAQMRELRRLHEEAQQDAAEDENYVTDDDSGDEADKDDKSDKAAIIMTLRKASQFNRYPFLL